MRGIAGRRPAAAARAGRTRARGARDRWPRSDSSCSPACAPSHPRSRCGLRGAQARRMEWRIAGSRTRAQHVVVTCGDDGLVLHSLPEDAVPVRGSARRRRTARQARSSWRRSTSRRCPGCWRGSSVKGSSRRCGFRRWVILSWRDGMSIATTVRSANGLAERATAWLATPLLFAFRWYVAWQFLKSGWLKVSEWDSTLYLFQEEYHVPLLPPAAGCGRRDRRRTRLPATADRWACVTRVRGAGTLGGQCDGRRVLCARAVRRRLRGGARPALSLGHAAARRAGVRPRPLVARRVAGDGRRP